MTTPIKQRPKVTQRELVVLAGKLSYLKGMVAIERKVDGNDSYRAISKTMEEAIIDCGDIADRLLYNGLETEQ